jgi:hypothetical protein
VVRSSRIVNAAKRIRATTLVLAALCAFTLSGTVPAGETYDWEIVRCESDFPLEDAETLRSEFAILRRFLADDLGLDLGEQAVELRLFSDRREYIRQISPIVPDANRQRGVYVSRDGEVRVYSFQQRDLATTLHHESVHAWLHSALPYVPLWLDEVLASYYEVAGVPRSLAHPFASRVRWSLRLGWRPKLTSLEAIARSSDMDIGDYRHAWAWVDFLLNESDETREILAGYLKNIADGEPPEPLSEVLSEKLPGAESRLLRYFSGGGR